MFIDGISSLRWDEAARGSRASASGAALGMLQTGCCHWRGRCAETDPWTLRLPVPELPAESAELFQASPRMRFLSTQSLSFHWHRPVADESDQASVSMQNKCHFSIHAGFEHANTSSICALWSCSSEQEPDYAGFRQGELRCQRSCAASCSRIPHDHHR